MPVADPNVVPDTVAETDPGRIQGVFECQREHAGALRAASANTRIAKLKRLRDGLLARREAIYRACHADFAKPAAEVDITEILPVVAEANHAIRRLKGWMRPKRKRPTLLMLGTAAEVRYEPRGVCLIISPWNYPINLSLAPLVSAIAAGNAVILKPSEMTPHCAMFMAELIGALFADHEVAVVQGAVRTAQTLLDLPLDHIFFTGSPAIGKIVMGAAARHLTSVTLELGGKSPAIVDKTADISAAATRLVWAKFANNGQTCIAPDTIYVHADIQNAFIDACKKALNKLYGERAGRRDNPDYCRIVNAKHAERLRALIDDAITRGARVSEGCTAADGDRYIAPTLLTDIAPQSRILEEEIFGPLIPILAFHDIAQPLARINAQPKPLALYVFARDNDFIEQLLGRTSAGGSCVNHAMLHFLHARLPFGGVNGSGIGNAHGHYGFKAFSHERAVLRERFSLAFLFMPPYTRFTRWFIRFAVKWLN